MPAAERSSSGHEYSGQHLDRRRLACPVGTDVADHLSPVHKEGQVVGRGDEMGLTTEAADLASSDEGAREVVDLDQGMVSCPSTGDGVHRCAAQVRRAGSAPGPPTGPANCIAAGSPSGSDRSRMNNDGYQFTNATGTTKVGSECFRRR